VNRMGSSRSWIMRRGSWMASVISCGCSRLSRIWFMGSLWMYSMSWLSSVGFMVFSAGVCICGF